MNLFKKNKSNNFNLKKKKFSDIDPFIEIGNIVKEARIKGDLTIEELSNISKIPLSNIIGIENNIKDLIPKYPFIRSILLKLEECLSLEKFKLINTLKKNASSKKQKKINKFIFNNFDLLNTWNSGVIYLFILLICIFVLNKYYLNNRIIEFKYIEKSLKNK
tara:strand:+ start:410 stop:895 length:486 start_codon:yes stop_codon:yes gene_type:complete